ncbi:hypothetical protein ACFLU5_12145 [Bacteroidota bacterium]
MVKEGQIPPQEEVDNIITEVFSGKTEEAKSPLDRKWIAEDFIKFTEGLNWE